VKILVTGAFGFIGLALVRHLTAAGHEVVAFGHAPRNPAARSRIPQGVVAVEGQLEDVEAVVAAHGRLDGIAHLAGGGGPARVAADPAAAVTANVRGTTRLLEAAHAAGVKRLVFASTIQVYGVHRTPTGPYEESDGAAPDDLYGVLKEAAEHAWLAFGGGAALRLANVYGAGSGVDLGVQGAVERFARAAASGGELTVFGEGQQRIDYVHVDDVCRAFRLALESGVRGPFNVGGGAPIAIRELAERCIAAGRALGASPHLVQKPAPEGKAWPDRSLCNERAREALGWYPERNYDEAIPELVGMMHAT
jgi:UDP-glucose 4-epimerase